ncbi:MAG: DUF1194 domain-containing protein, partial [Alphaproteobacteria bacterium]|nr:DUF1194 domain-containing protein [Alphaproteobacteria bacterium]
HGTPGMMGSNPMEATRSLAHALVETVRSVGSRPRMRLTPAKHAGTSQVSKPSLLASAAYRAALTLLLVMLAGLTALTAQVSNALANNGCVDVALVLAVDGSGSVNAREYNFQKSAIAASLRDPGVLKAMKRAGTVSMAVVFWGDPERATQSTDAVLISDADDAETLARMVENQSRTVLGNTGLGAGLAAAMDKLATMGCAYRSIVNVSGDGQETTIPCAPSRQGHAHRRKGLRSTPW